MKPILYLALVAFLFVNVQCGSNSSGSSSTTDTSSNKMTDKKEKAASDASGATADNATPSGENGSVAPGRKYGIPSATITYERESGMRNMKVSSKEILYFREFGQMECRESYMSSAVNGSESMNLVTINRDGYSYSYNPASKNGTKFKLSAGSDPASMDIEEIKKKYKFNELPEEPVCDKLCKTIEVTLPMGKGKICIWNNIIMSMIMDDPKTGMVMNLKAVSIQEKGEVAPNRFDLPAGINFVEH